MPSLLRSLATAGRSLRRRPRTTLYTLALLAIGVGLPTATFSLLDGVLLRGLPFPEGDRIVRITTVGDDRPIPAGDFESLASAIEGLTNGGRPLLSGLAGDLSLNTVVTRPGIASKGMTGTYVTGKLFRMLEVEPALGRGFAPRDAAGGAPPVVIVSHRLWRRWFGGDPRVIGEEVIVNREPMTVIGVMPPGFQFPVRQEVWIPIRRGGWLARGPRFAVARLAPGVQPEEAELALAPLAGRLDEEDPLGGGRERHLAVTPYVETLVPPEIDHSLRLMLWAVLGILLIACGNVASLRLGEVLGRSRELTVRRALGARASQLLRPLLAETALLAGAGAAAGIGVAWMLVHLGAETVLRASMVERLFWVDVRLDGRACLFAACAAVVAALLGTLPPALWSLGRRNLRLGTGGERTGQRGPGRLAGFLVVAQVAVCFVLVSASALLVASGRSVLTRDPGFDPDGLMRVLVNPFQAEWRGPEEPRAFWNRLLPRLEDDPAVAGATLASGVPWGTERGIERVLVGTGKNDSEAGLLQVLPGFFETLRLPILAGRALEPRDIPPAEAGSEGPRELPVVVSARLASRSLGPRPLGETLELEPADGRGDRDLVRGRVVGIAADRVGRPGDDGTVYAPLAVEKEGSGFLLVRGRSGHGDDLLHRIDRAVAGVDPRVATLDAATYREDRAETFWVERRLTELVGLFAVASMVLAGFGLFGVAVLVLRRRRRELAIRSALGARPGALRSLVLRQGLLWIGLGLAAGAALTGMTHGLLRAFLHGIGPWDPVLTVGAAALVVLALSAAVLGPAHRAARTDPAVVVDAE